MPLFKRLFGTSKKAEPPADSEGPVPYEAASRYRRVEAKYLEAGRGYLLACMGRRAKLLASAEADVLRRCYELATIEDHARRLCDQLDLDSSEAQAIEAQLRGFAGEGLLAREPQVAAPLAGPSPQVTAPRKEPSSPQVTTLSFVSCDRVATARRALERCCHCLGSQNDSLELAFFDDSKTAAGRDETLAMVRETEAACNRPIFYAGVEEKTAFVDRLAGEGLPRRTLEHALFGQGCANTTGGNENAALLHSAGELAAVFDDDVLFGLAPSPAKEEGVSLCSRHDPTELWFYETRADALASTSDEGPTVISQLQSVLGLPTSEVLSERHGAPIDVTHASDRLLHAAQGPGRIAVTTLGTMGDSGMGSTRYYLFQRGAARERLVASEVPYAKVATTRNVRRAAARVTISEGTFFMTPAVAYDLRQLLPPMFPVLRNGDGIFAETLRRVCPTLFIAHLPWMVAHDPPVERRSSKELDLEMGTSFRMDALIIQCLKAIDLPGREDDPRARMVALGQRLRWYGELSPQDFEEFLLLRLRRAMTENIIYLERSLAMYHGEPEPWADHVSLYAEALQDALEDRDLAVPTDLPDQGDRDKNLQLAQELIARFGELLELWPDIVATTERLKDSGITLARPCCQGQ